MRSAGLVFASFSLAVLLATPTTAATPTVTSISPAQAERDSIVIDVAVAGSSFEQGTMPSPPGAVEYDGHLYEVVTDQKYWHAARDDCVARGGHLVTITSSAEHGFLQALSASGFWLGFTDEVTEGQYRWVTAEPFSYSNWAVAQPDNGDLGPATDEDYGEMWTDGTTGRWNDSIPDNLKDYVCEYDTPPPPAVYISMSGESDIVARNVRFLDSTRLAFDLDLTGAASGDWDVVVTNPGGESDVLPGGFTVLDLHSIVPGPVTSFTATEASLSRIDLAWVNPSDSNVMGVVVFRRANAAPTFVPTHGTPYTVGVACGDSECVYDGAVAAFSDSPLTPELTYHYAAYAHDGDYTYSAAAVTSARVARPYVETTSPADQGTGVPVDSAIEVTFSEPMNTTSAESACYVSGGVTGTRSWAGNTLILAPSQPLDHDHYYAVTVTSGATDASGVALADTYTFVFTTAAEDTGGDKGGLCGADSHGSPLAWALPLVLLALALTWSHRRVRREARTRG